MDNFLAVLDSCLAFFSAYFINIRNRFYKNYWQFLSNNDIHELWLVSRPPKNFCLIFDLVLWLLEIFHNTYGDTALFVKPEYRPQLNTHIKIHKMNHFW